MRDLLAESLSLCDGPVVASTCEVCGAQELAPHSTKLPLACTLCDGPLGDPVDVTPSQAHLRALWEGLRDRDVAIRSLLRAPTKGE